MSDVVLRPARPEDAEAVAAIWHPGWRDGHLGNVPDVLVAFRTAESFRSRAAQRVDDTVIALVGDEVAGFVMVAGAEVEQVYVAAGHRGSGVAGVLLAEAERLVAAAGHRRAWLAVAPGNARARRFYQRCGWRDDGLFDHAAPVPDGTMAVPCNRYVKPLPARAGSATATRGGLEPGPDGTDIRRQRPTEPAPGRSAPGRTWRP